VSEVVSNAITDVNVTIRPYQDGDTQGILDLIADLQRNEFDINSLTDQPDLANIDGFYGQGSSGFWVAVAADKIVGTIALLDITQNQAALRNRFVAPDYRGKDVGVSEKLLNHLFEQARSSGVQDIYLGTTADIKTDHKFYENHGFARYSKTDLPARFPILTVDSWFYHKSV
jgi:N-acetylglutamate synthase-like GNAT family acetyltransferase